MTKVVLDAAVSLDGISFDFLGASLYPIEEMHESGLIAAVAARTGAVVMSQRSFHMAEDVDWYADNYELQAPIYVITEDPPSKAPKSNDRLSFRFVADLQSALVSAREAAGNRDVMLIGEPSIVQAAFDAKVVDEFYLRVIPRVVGKGTPLFDGQIPTEFRRTSVSVSTNVTHLHLVRSSG